MLRFWPQLACMWHFTYDLRWWNNLVILPQQSSAHRYFMLFLAFLNLQDYGLAFVLRYDLQDIRALVLKHASVFQKRRWGPTLELQERPSNCKRDQSVMASRKCLRYSTLFENPCLCSAPWASTSVPWKTNQYALFLPSMSGQCCPRIFAKHLGDKYTTYTVIIVAFG